jgi:hypothetical protein
MKINGEYKYVEFVLALVAPDGPIYLVMRLYWLKTTPPSILPTRQGTWRPPGVKRVS